MPSTGIQRILDISKDYLKILIIPVDSRAKTVSRVQLSDQSVLR